MSRGSSRFCLILVMLAVLTFVGMVSAAAAAPVRLYLQNQTSPVTMTTRGTWTSSTGVISTTIGRTKIGTATTRGAAEATTTNPYKYHLVRFISEPIAAQSLSGTLNWTIGALQSNTAMTANFAIHVTVVSNNGATVRGTLLSNVAETGNTWPTTPAAGKSPLTPQTLTAVTAQAGDRIQVEIGYAARNTSTTSYTGTINYGGTGATDLTAGSTSVTTQPGWFEFSQLLFDPTAPSNLAAPTVTATSVGLTWTADTVNNTLGYNVYRDGTLIASNVMTGSYTDTTVLSNTTYNTPGYTVRGVNEAGESANSNAVPVTTPVMNNTVVGTLSYSAITSNSYTVTASYAGDDNNSNTCSIIYSTSATYSPYSTAPAPTRVGKSWVTTLSGLNEGTLYYVRATFNDTDAPALSNVNVDGSRATIYNQLIHKSANLGTKYGTWGATYTCATCHTPNSANIKRISTTISTRAVSATNAAIYGANNTTHATSNQVCEVCHTQPTVHKYNQPAAVNHWNNDCIGCHKHNAAFKPPACTVCHAAGNPYGAPVVTATSPHVKADGVTFGDCTDCHTGHYSATGGVNIPNKTAAGINYGHGGIKLGGPGTVASISAKTTEAEICWGCHQAMTPDISEWGTNTGGTYNYGSVTTDNLNWTTTTWSSANFSYKNGPLYTRPIRGDATNAGDVTTRGDASLHASGGTVGTQSNNLAEVRCSYCHDVHDSYGVTGKPYLRAAWRVNPYKEDGAPRSGQAWVYSDTSQYGAVPRGGGTNLSVMGGWQIDINNGNPNSGAYAYATNDALCASCHTQATLESTAPLHKNSVKGFTNDTTNSTTLATNRNILRVGAFVAGDMHPSHGGTMTAHSTAVGNPKMGYYVAGDTTSTQTEQGGIRESDSSGTWPTTSDIWDLTANDVRYAYRGFPAGTAGAQGITQDLTTVQPDYHSFTCSKCHNPHASRLPRLMITNCLDVNVNTWDDTLTPTTNTAYTRSADNNPANINQLAYVSSAQNCHRYTENASGATRGTVVEKGWNAVTPW